MTGCLSNVCYCLLRRLHPLQTIPCPGHKVCMVTVAKASYPLRIQGQNDNSHIDARESSKPKSLIPFGNSRYSFQPSSRRFKEEETRVWTNRIKPNHKIYSLNELEFIEMKSNKQIQKTVNENTHFESNKSNPSIHTRPELAGFKWPASFSPSPCNTFCCSTLDSMSNQNHKEKKQKQPDLEKMAHLLTYDLLNIFLKNQRWELYHPNMIFEDNIRGKRYLGLTQYKQIVNIFKITAHIRFVYVRFHILQLKTHSEDGTVRIRWRISGLGMLRLIFKYFPQKLWMKGNMDKEAPTWYDGISTFYVGSDDRIFKHKVDRVIKDQKPEKSESLADKLKKLKPVTEPLSPAL